MDTEYTGNNQLCADNQQGRLDPWWIVGFVDGEGCFSISIIKNATTKRGYQIFPEFVVAQGERSLSVLEELQNFFGCGKIYKNTRHDNHREPLYRYCVRSQTDLRYSVQPFFERYSLKSAKQNDFIVFCEVLEILHQKQHLTDDGFHKVCELASTTNRHKSRIKNPQRLHARPR